MNFVSRIRTQPMIALFALILTFSVAVPLTVQTIAADASTASVAKKKRKKCKKGYKKVTTKKKGKKVTKCVKQMKLTPKPTTPPPLKPLVALTQVNQHDATTVRLRGYLEDIIASEVKCTTHVGYSDFYLDQQEFTLTNTSKFHPFDQIVPMPVLDHGGVKGAMVECNGVQSLLVLATA